MNPDVLNWIILAAGSYPPARKTVWVKDAAGKIFRAYWDDVIDGGYQLEDKKGEPVGDYVPPYAVMQTWYHVGTGKPYGPPNEPRVIEWAEGT